MTGRVEPLREQDSNLQPCGYGILQSFRFGPDYLITLSELACFSAGESKGPGACGAYR